MDIHLRIDGDVWRRAREKAGSVKALGRLVSDYLQRYVEDQTEAQQHGARGGSIAAERMTPEQRVERARKASAAAVLARQQPSGEPATRRT